MATGSAARPRLAIGVMAKAPVPGVAKTRLVPLVGEVRAAELHRLFLLDTLTAARASGSADLFVVCPDGWQEKQLRGVVPSYASILVQRGRGLMAGLASALEDLLGLGYSAVVLSDADSPTLPPRRFADAFLALTEGADVVLGPCADGGYYLIGARQHRPELFDLACHPNRICQETAEHARALGLTVRLLEGWYDVDEPAELATLARDLEEHPEWAPASAGELLASYPADYLASWLPTSGPWETVRSESVDVSPWRVFRRDLVQLEPGGERTITYTYLEVPRAVFVVPLTADGRIVLVRQYRYPVRNWVWEVPAGSVEPGETSREAARRELVEEAGGECEDEDLEFLASYRSSSAHMDLAGDYYLASRVRLGTPRPESTEVVEARLFGVEQAMAMARRGEVSDGQSALALLAAEPLIRRRLDR
jgi:uncharacterized protein